MKNINCPICSAYILVHPAKGRKSNKPFIMLKCPVDGRHFRGFITDQTFVKQVIEKSNTSNDLQSRSETSPKDGLS